MRKFGKENNSLVRTKYVFIEIDGELQTGLAAMLKSGAADSYKDAISKLFNYWIERIDSDQTSSIDFPQQHKLSKRQKQLIPLIYMGRSNKEIAESLCLSEHTVKVHIWRLFKKLNVRSRTQLLYAARVHGWI